MTKDFDLSEILEKVKDVDFSNEANFLEDPLNRAFCHLFAVGYDLKKCHEILSLSETFMAELLTSERIKKEISKIRADLFKSDANKEFKTLTPVAVGVIKEVMLSASERGATRAQAAMYALDRAHGKPTQQMEVGGSLIRTLIEALDKEKQPPIETTAKKLDNVEEALLEEK